jgi:hypothetical protein
MSAVSLYKGLVYLLAIILVLIFLGQVFMILINPETFFFGFKLGGEKAIAYLAVNSLCSLLLTYVVLRKTRIGLLLSLIYSLYNLGSIAITSLELFGEFFLAPIFGLSLILSITALLLQR